jgi:hypothetical protein
MTQSLLSANKEIAAKSLKHEAADIELKRLRDHNKILQKRCDK